MVGSGEYQAVNDLKQTGGRLEVFFFKKPL
jgi:hypothetical protein